MSMVYHGSMLREHILTYFSDDAKAIIDTAEDAMKQRFRQ